MNRNMNAGRLLYMICLLAFSVVGGKLEAQTVVQPVEQQHDSIKYAPIHQIGFDIRPGYVAPTNSFLEGDNAQQKRINQSLSLHLKYAFRFSKDSNLGRLYPHAYQGIGISYNTFYCPAELGNPVAVYAFQGARIMQVSPRLSFDYEWNFGASFGWKKYDGQYYPQNEVIGSKINAYINLGLVLNWQLHPQWKLAAGVDLTHFSNGNTHYPNGGLNVIGGRIGVVRTFGEEDASTDVPKRLYVKPHISYDLVLSGRAEYVMPYFTVGPGIGTNVLHKGGDRNDYYRESLPQMFPLEHFPKGVIPIYLPLSMLFPTLMVWRKAYCDCLTSVLVNGDFTFIN